MRTATSARPVRPDREQVPDEYDDAQTGVAPASWRSAPLIALAAGAVNVFSFAPFGIWPLQIATMSLVFWLVLRAASPGRAALTGWAYAFGWIAAGVHWLYISMHDYGGLPGWMAAAAVALLAAGLGLYSAIAMAGSIWLKRRYSLASAAVLLLAFPSAWTLAEWLRGWTLTGFPWLISGYAHSAGPLAGFAPVVGVYGLGWLSALVAGSVVLLLSDRRAIALPVLVLVLGLGLRSVEWTQANGAPITVRLLQGNVPQEMKFAPEVVASTLSLYQDMILAAPADLIATPETALPVFAHHLPPDYLDRLAGFARDTKSHLVLGIPLSDGPAKYANSVFGFSPGAAKAYRYDKHHLVPFGEFIPPGARWFVNMMNIPLGDFTRGDPLQPPFAVKDQWVMPNICYEDLFGEEIAAQLAASHFSGMPQATVLLNLSNIAWFGDSIALPQHLQISQLRALETGRPMLRATNTGVTAVIDPKGEVAAQMRPFERGVLTASVQGYKGLTPYSVYGNAPVIALAFIALGAAWVLGRRKGHESHGAGKTR